MLARFWRWLVMSQPPVRVIYLNEGQSAEEWTADLLEEQREPAAAAAFAELDQRLVDRALAEHRDDLLDFVTRPQEPTE